MDLNPYLETLRTDLASNAAPGGEEVRQAAEMLAGSLESAARLCLLEALSDAAAEITTKLDAATVEVRLRGREADLVVNEAAAPDAPAPMLAAPVPPPADADAGDVARITLRLPEQLKTAVERAAGAESISVNAWLVRAIGAAVHTGHAPPPSGRARYGRRVTGYAQA